MPITLIPYGQLQSGRLGVAVSDTTGQPIAGAVEIQTTLPLVGDALNFDGRLVFETSTQTLFVFKSSTPEWFPLEGIPVTIGLATDVDPVSLQPIPPTSGSEIAGELFYATDVEVAYVWDGGAWRPIGGRFAGQWVEQKYTSTGFGGAGGDTFALGVVPVNPEFVEVFLDGVRQVRNPSGDFNVVGGNVVFPSPVPVDVEVFTRTFFSTVLVSPAIQPNTQIAIVNYTATAGQTEFDTGLPVLDPNGTFVFVDGLLQSADGVDYVHSTFDTTINSILRSGSTATVTTANPHGAGIGDDVEIIGADQPEYNGTFTITAVPTSTTFQYTVVGTPVSPATTSTVLFYTPPFVNDTIIFGTPLVGGENVHIRGLKSLVSAPPTGEANTASNLGGGIGLFSTKVASDLRFKSVAAGPNITVVDLGSEVQISTTVGSTFEGRSGINTNLHVLATTESYIGVRNTSFIVTIDVSSVPAGTAGSGRRVVIVDESGGASVNNILISHAGATFSGTASPLVINNNYGSKTIVYDGTNWHIVAET